MPDHRALGQKVVYMHLLHLAQHWLHADPPGTHHLLVGVVAVALIWVLFERVGVTAQKYR